MKTSSVLGLLATLLVVGAVWFLSPQSVEPQLSRETVEEGEVSDPQRASVAEVHVEEQPADEGENVRSRAVGHNNEGVRLLKAGLLDEALVEFELAYRLSPLDTAFRNNLAEALGRRAVRTIGSTERDLAAAVADLERALLLAPSREDLRLLLERWRAELELAEQFTTYTSIHFDLSFDGDRDTILANSQLAIDVLEEAYGEFWLFFDHDPVAQRGARLQVTFYEPEQFRAVTGLGHWAGGAFDGTLRLPIENFDQERSVWTRTLRHELCHAFLDTASAERLPGWFEEGLAQWLEGDTSQDVAHAERTLGDLELIPLAELSGPLSGLGKLDRIARGYAEGLLFTLYLIEQYGDSTVSAMVSGTHEGRSIEASFEQRIGVSLSQVLADFDEQRRR